MRPAYGAPFEKSIARSTPRVPSASAAAGFAAHGAEPSWWSKTIAIGSVRSVALRVVLLRQDG